MEGVISWFNFQKGFGFIRPDDGGVDVFVHASSAERAGITVREGDRIAFEIVIDRGGKPRADKLALLSSAARD
jgi:CspA family cold shock protein